MIGIRNKKELDKWIIDRVNKGHSVFGIKGPPPPGMTYSDGDPITGQVNVAWRCPETEEVMEIVYGDVVPT